MKRLCLGFRRNTLNVTRMYSSKKISRILSSTEIRKKFTDFFIENHNHQFIRSSPVVPFCDPTVAFVNAGMNQFKSVFLGKTVPPCKRATNFQKCVRVGGKHNDLSIVGQDGYHHTFFEMLGNWSFGDYFKREACEMALELLKGPYKIDASRLYVTYFGGDKTMGLPPDLECFEIWRSLGFGMDRILPFGSKENFWEMGKIGPCGPCTEIHVDHRPELSFNEKRSNLVNAGHPDLTELWNLVFIQYNRNDDGSIEKLPTWNVDTGMGFERLTAILQNKPSNYDTDIFLPIFSTIQKISKVAHYGGQFPSESNKQILDTGYRIIADHSRMVTVCLADGMLPDQNQKLRRILRKAFMISENVFANRNLIKQLIPILVETMGSVYPEISEKQKDINELIDHEQDVFKALRDSSSKALIKAMNEFPDLEPIDFLECPGFVPALKEYQLQKHSFRNKIIPGKFLYKLSDTYGLSADTLQKLAKLEGMALDEEGYLKEIQNARQKTKSKFSVWMLNRIDEQLLKMSKNLPATENSYKYKYDFNSVTQTYHIPTITTRILGIIQNGQEVQRTTKTSDILCIVTDRSNFYFESGGQQSDRGVLISNSQFQVDIDDVCSVNNCVVHVGKFSSNAFKQCVLKVGDEVKLIVESNHRKFNIYHHTATHLLNGAIRSLFKKVIYQVSSSVTRDNCKLELGLIGKRLTKDDIQNIEQLIRDLISSATPIIVTMVSMSDILQQPTITLVPGEIYPETGLRLLTIRNESLGFLSNELCCGTHARNTREIGQFCIVNFKQTNRARYAFTAVAGQLADNALQTAAIIKSHVDQLDKQNKSIKNEHYKTEVDLLEIRNSILHSDLVLPYTFKVDIVERINEILKKIKEASRTSLKEFVEYEIKNVLNEKPKETHPFIVHFLSSSPLVEEVSLQRATKLCTDRPILVISMTDCIIKARCCVPKSCITKEFTAEKWLQEFASVFEAQVASPKGQDANKVCNMKGKKISTEFDDNFDIAMEKAKKFAAAKM